MSDQTIGRLGQRSQNVVDRRDEFDELTRLMMAVGMQPPPSANSEYAKYYGILPGEFLDSDLDPIRSPTPLGLDAGANDLDNQYAHLVQPRPTARKR